MAVYILRHPSPDFTGVKGGVDFYMGKGSTSSLQDALALQKLGYSVTDAEDRPVEVVVKIHPQAHVEILTAKTADSAAPATAITEEGAAQPAAPSPSLSELKAAEDNPDSAWSKGRAEADRQAKRRGGRRRKQ